MSLDPIYPEDDFGAKADANGPNGGPTDNGPAFTAALIKGLPSGSPVVLGKSGQHYGVRTTIAWHGGVGQGLLGPNPSCRRGPVDVPRGVWLWWTGVPAGRMIELYGMQCRMEGFGIGCSVGTSVDRLVDIDNPAALKIPYVTSTSHYFRNLQVSGGYGGPAANGFVVGESGGPNNEFHRWEGCWFTVLSGSGVNVPNGTGQAKGLQFHDCNWTRCGHAFSAAIASAHFVDCNVDACGLAFWWNGGAYEPCSIIRLSTESCARLVQAGGVNLAIRDSRLAPNAAGTVRPPFGQEWISVGGDVTMDNVIVDSSQPGFYVRAGDDNTLTLLSTHFDSCNYLPLSLGVPPYHFSVVSFGSSYWERTHPIPAGNYRQDNLPNNWNDAGKSSQLAPLTVPPAAP